MIDRALFIMVSALIVIGIIFSYSLSAYTVLLFDYEPYHFALRQTVFGLFSIAVMWSISYLDPNRWLLPLGFGLFIISLVAMAVMPILPDTLVTAAGGAKRWIRLSFFSVAPVEFFKIGFVAFLAWSFSRKMEPRGGVITLKEEFRVFMPYAFVFFVAVFLIAYLQNDIGQVVVLGLTLLFMMLIAGSSFAFFFLILGASFIGFVTIILLSPHRIERIKMWWASVQNTVLSLFPDSLAERLRVDYINEGYQVGQSLNAIHNGGWFGVGYGNGILKLGFLSEVHTDFVLSGVAEESGFLGVFVITLLVLFALQRVFKIANRSANQVHYLFALGVGLMMGFAFLINAYGIIGLAPIKGLSVPFISYGGSSLLALSIGVGMVLMISKNGMSNQEIQKRSFNEEQQ